MKTLRSKIIFVAVSLCLILAACVHDPVVPEPVNTGEVSFKNEILPLLESACAIVGCHTGNNPPQKVNLSSYSLVIQTANVEAGNPDESKLYQVMAEDSPSKVMPPGSPLPSAQIELVKRWIEEGAKDN